jgi:endonuclease/exonuclease/phosphatase family metal-dependent hydrolase
MKKAYIFIFFILVSSCKADPPIKTDTLFVAFWNLENLYDTIDDPNNDDQEFLPDGLKEWTQDRLDKKMYNISRVFNSMNDGKSPDVIGVVECENEAVLKKMVQKHFSSKNYKIAYAESPDTRGIDNGFIYDADKYKFISSNAYEIKKLSSTPTRLILHVILQTKNGEQINFFVNHWPSRRDGASESEYKRIETAKVLRREVDRVFDKNSYAKIIIMGDFNDEPVDESILKTLGADPFKCDPLNAKNVDIPGKELYNLSYNLFESGLGTLSYREDWNLFDQVIISSGLVTQKGLSYLCDSFSIFNNDLVTTRSGKYKDTPFPTYGGNRYLGGYSDHFAVSAKFILR